jgi:hypothetical protein
MTQTNDAVRALFANFPVAELGSVEQRTVFHKIKDRFSQTADAELELKDLYKVKGFSDFAAVLMWILERAQKDPQLAAVGPADETLLLSTFRKAMSEQGFLPPSAPSPREEPGGQDEKAFAAQLEKFSEAIQGGVEGRGPMLEALFNDCGHAANSNSGDEFKQFNVLLADFLKYIAESELLDDVRVINILSNVSSAVTQWASASSEARPSLMEEAMGMLRDFKTHFE